MPTYRQLNPSDMTQCANIMESLHSHYGHPLGGQWTRDRIQSELIHGKSYGTFDQADNLVAFCLYRPVDDGKIEIMLLATAERFHRTGAMKSLIRSLIDHIGAVTIWLEVHAGNLPAISLYEDLGFLQVGSRPDYYSDGGKALLYEYKPLQ